MRIMARFLQVWPGYFCRNLSTFPAPPCKTRPSRGAYKILTHFFGGFLLVISLRNEGLLFEPSLINGFDQTWTFCLRLRFYHESLSWWILRLERNSRFRRMGEVSHKNVSCVNIILIHSFWLREAYAGYRPSTEFCSSFRHLYGYHVDMIPFGQNRRCSNDSSSCAWKMRSR